LPSGNWKSVCYGNGKFIAVAFGSDTAAYSTDGIHWDIIQLNVSGVYYWVSISYGLDDDIFGFL